MSGSRKRPGKCSISIKEHEHDHAIYFCLGKNMQFFSSFQSADSVCGKCFFDPKKQLTEPGQYLWEFGPILNINFFLVNVSKFKYYDKTKIGYLREFER